MLVKTSSTLRNPNLPYQPKLKQDMWRILNLLQVVPQMSMSRLNQSDLNSHHQVCPDYQFLKWALMMEKLKRNRMYQWKYLVKLLTVQAHHPQRKELSALWVIPLKRKRIQGNISARFAVLSWTVYMRWQLITRQTTTSCTAPPAKGHSTICCLYQDMSTNTNTRTCNSLSVIVPSRLKAK